MPARLDRVLSLWVNRSMSSAGQRERSTGLPILMYHSISEDPELGIHPYYRVATTPARFADQMRWMAEANLRGISLEDALQLQLRKDPEIHRCVVLTFDDGFEDFYTEAWPILARHGFTATMYLPTSFIADQRKTFRGKTCLLWSEVREMRARGIRFGSHTVSHPKLYDISFEMIATELKESKAQMEHQLGEKINSFAYPFAFPQEDLNFVTTFAGLLRRFEYQSCVTTIIGCALPEDDLLQLKRLPANSCDDRLLFTAKLNGAYDWLGAFQRASRQLRFWAKPGKARRAVVSSEQPIIA